MIEASVMAWLPTLFNMVPYLFKQEESLGSLLNSLDPQSWAWETGL